MDSLIAIVTALSTGFGVVVGGYLTMRTQRQSHDLSLAEARRREQLDACVAYLATARKFRHHAMYSDFQVETIPPSTESRDTAVLGDSAEYRNERNEASSRLEIVCASDSIVGAAKALSAQLGQLFMNRARYGKGKIPDASVGACRLAEERFAAAVRAEFRIGFPIS